MIAKGSLNRDLPKSPGSNLRTTPSQAYELQLRLFFADRQVTKGKSPNCLSPCRFSHKCRGRSGCFPEWIFERRTLRCEQLRAVFCDVHVVFQANAKFAANIDARLVAGGHVGLKFG